MLASITAPEMTDNLRNILEHAEGLGMPDGEYLRVANALRDAFNAAPAPGMVAYRPRHRFVIERTIQIVFKNKSKETNSITLLSQTRTDTGPGRSDTVKCEYRYTRPDGIMRYITGHTHFNNIVRDFLFLHQPKTVHVRTDIGDYKVCYGKVVKDNRKEVEELQRRLAIQGLPEAVQENMIDRLSEIADFTYGDFVSEVVRRIPDGENLYHL